MLMLYIVLIGMDLVRLAVWLVGKISGAGPFVADPGHGPDLERALAGRDPNEPVLLLCHQPRIADEADRLDVDLTLTGHTHGGQIQPWGAFVRLQQPYVSGLHRHGKAQIYVSEGTGFWGPPMRVGSSSEITLVTLRRG